MEGTLIFIKHHFAHVWRMIEYFNSNLFSLLYKSSLNNAIYSVFDELVVPSYAYRKLVITDASSLYNLINSQEEADLEYFKPHGFDKKSIISQFFNRSFLMMGVFDNDKLIGYFFLRFFANKKCFVGRLIDRDYRGRGIGKEMNKIMYQIAWRMGFRCLSTISRNNKAVIRAHSNNRTMVLIKELQNDFLLVEFVNEK